MTTEAHEIARSLPSPMRALTFDQCRALVREQVGTPQDIGFQVFDNIAAALHSISRTAQTWEKDYNCPACGNGWTLTQTHDQETTAECPFCHADNIAAHRIRTPLSANCLPNKEA